MSTIVVTRKGGRAAIGADTLTKHGYTRQKADLIVNHQKILRCGDSFLAVTGEASWTLVLADYLARRKKSPRLDSAAAIFAFARELHRDLKEEYFLNPSSGEDEDPFETTQIDCLIANPAGIFGLYALRSVDEFTRYYAFGSGRPFALGAIHAVWDRAETAEEACRIGLEAAAEFDDDSGPPLEIHHIDLA